MAIAGILPNGSNLPFDCLPFVKMLPLVFDNENAPIGQHRHKVGVELAVGQLKPEGGLLSFDISNPIANLFVPVEMNRAPQIMPMS